MRLFIANHDSRIRTAVLCLSACLLSLTCFAQDSTPSATGNAGWIWHPDTKGSAGLVYLAKTFTLPIAPTEATCLCTADNEYVLYVNGRLAGRSPGPGNATDWWHRLDQHDVRKLLKKGANVIAVEANNSGGPGGFIGKLNVSLPNGEILNVITDEYWSASVQKPDGWPSPTLPFGKQAVNLGQPPVEPWAYPSLPSKLSQTADALRIDLVSKLVLPKSIVEIRAASGALTSKEEMLKQDGISAHIDPPPGKQADVILDFGKEVVGSFRCATSGGPATLDLAYGESLQECLHEKPFQAIDHLDVNVDKFEWTNPQRRAFRYVKVTISECKNPLDVDYFGLDLVGYPVENKGSFRCSDELLNHIWEVGRYTTSLCMQDYHEDGVKRDRMLWIGDLRIEALSGYYAFGEYKLPRRDLIRIADNQLADGAIPAVGPGPATLILPDYCAYFVSVLWEYYLHSGDRKMVELLYPNVKHQVEWFETQLNEHSLIKDADRKDWWCFIDWSDMDKKDEVTALEAIYYDALQSAINIAQVMGDRKKADGYRTRAALVKNAINQRLWSQGSGAYVDCRTSLGPSQRISQQSNCLAVLFGIADPSRRESIQRIIFDPSKVEPTTTPYMNFYVVKSLYSVEKGQQALDLIRSYWGGMLKRGATTYWEVYDPRKPEDFVLDSGYSYCHGWSAGVTSILPAEVVGVKPTKPGFEEIIIAPQLADLEWAQAIVPAPRGDITVSWNTGYSGRIELPNDCRALVCIPADPAKATITLDDAIVWSEGKARAKGAYSEGTHIYFTVTKPGKHVVKTSS